MTGRGAAAGRAGARRAGEQYRPVCDATQGEVVGRSRSTGRVGGCALLMERRNSTREMKRPTVGVPAKGALKRV